MDMISSLWRTVIEIVFFWAIIYRLLLFVQGTRAVQLLRGIIVLIVLYAVAYFLDLTSIKWLLSNIFNVGLIVLVIIFQPELRRALARIGENAALRSMVRRGGVIDEIVEACEALAAKRTGGLVAIERDIGLRNYIESGIRLDAQVSAELLTTIFNPAVSFHDGGVIISENRIASCASLFPLSQNAEVSKTMGTRHRAALGLTEETDAIAIVVSEETGTMAVSVYGKMTRNIDGEGLRRVLMSLLRPNDNRTSIVDQWREKHAREPQEE